MSGHNKWSQIVRQKGSADAKRSKLFSMYGRQLAVQAKLASGDTNNPTLRAMIEKARRANMPNDTIERALKRASGGVEANLEEMLYEAFGPGGTAIVIQGITDSKNRTSQEIKHLLAENGGSLGSPGSTAWAFVASRALSGEVVYKPINILDISLAERGKLEKLVSILEEHADIRSVISNATQ